MKNSLSQLHWFGPSVSDVPALPDSKQPKDIFIFVHGWGVKWPSKGLFTSLAELLAKNGHYSVLIDMSDFDESGNATFLPLEDQQNRTISLVQHVSETYPGARVHLVSHSLGTRVVTSISRGLSLHVESFIFLAPPLGKRAKKPKKRMLRHANSYQLPNGGIAYPRKDGTESFVSKEFIHSFNKDWNMIYKRNLSTIDHKLIVLAEHDDRSEEQEDILANLGAVMLTDSDHNFTGGSIEELADMIELYISKGE